MSRGRALKSSVVKRVAALEHDHRHAALGELLRDRRAARAGADHAHVGADRPVARDRGAASITRASRGL